MNGKIYLKKKKKKKKREDGIQGWREWIQFQVSHSFINKFGIECSLQ